MSSVADAPIADGESIAVSAPSRDAMSQRYKRRAGRACSYCQWRKIRCNVENKHPCNNCETEKIDCVITKTRKSKKAKLNHTTAAPDPVGVLTPAAVPSGAAEEDPGNGEYVLGERNTTRLAGAHEVSSASQPPFDLPPVPDTRPEHLISPHFPSLSPSFGLSDSPRNARNDAGISEALNVPALPTYIKPVPPHLPSEDVDYLCKKGCFDLPPPKLRDAILRSYAEFFHPYMPILDLGAFLQSVTSTQPVPPHRQVSLLLFQAVMFAGSAHVDIKPLRRMGFLTRKAARKATYLKAKALYDMDYERSRMSVILALAIFSFWYEDVDEQKSPSHWLHAAFALGVRAGLDSDPTTFDVSETERKMMKRIWWSCVNRDVLCAIGTKSPLSVHSQQHNVPELVMDDFETGSDPREVYDHLGLTWSNEKTGLLHMAFLAQTGLLQILRSVVSKQYALRSYQSSSGRPSEASSEMTLAPATDEAAQERLSLLEAELYAWRLELAQDLQISSSESALDDNSLDSFIVFRTVLHMLYHLCTLVLYRPWLPPGRGSIPIHQEHRENGFESKIQNTVRDAARSITDLALELHRLDLLGHLPQTGLSALVAAVVSHVSDTLSPSDTLRKAGLRGYEECLHLLNELRDNYYSADFSAKFVKLIAQARTLTATAALQEGQKERLEDHVSAHSGFVSSGSLTSEQEMVGQDRPLALTRPLPYALFPEGLDLSIDLTSEADFSNNNWPLGLIDATNGDLFNFLSAPTERWDLDHNLGAEENRLLGDLHGI